MKDVGTTDANSYGLEGRPSPLKQMGGLATFALGSRFYAASRFLLDVQLKNFTILGEDGAGGFDFSAPFALVGGLGVLL